jgi:polysaccharide biosynthesis/export protein
LIFASDGCSTSRWPLSPDPTPEAQPVGSAGTVLGPGDVIEIKFAYASQFNESQTVRPDGKIVLHLIGPIAVQGKTPDQLWEELEKLYAGELKHPQLSVIVRNFHERRIYVGGEVNKPGLIEMPGSLNVMEAIMQAGGFNLEKAEVKSVVVVRNANGKQTGHLVNLKEALAGAEVQAFPLEPRDIVYVPRTAIANVDQWMSQYLYKIVPPLSIGVPLF